jgi:hypothetical protein
LILTREELRKMALPLLAALVLAAVGAALIAVAGQSLAREKQQLAAARDERKQASERLSRISEEEREVSEKLDVYRRLLELNILGPERRLEWADTMNRIRTQRELDLRYRVERQRLLISAPGKPAPVDFYASTMKVELALLHEEDLLRFLADLRASGNAYYSVQKCVLTRTGVAATAASLSPRLRGECDIDLVTILDRAAKR